jgi:hypothetical protein
MKTENNELLAEVVKKGIELAEKSGNFVIEQAPDLLREFYLWNLLQNVIVFFLSVLIIYFIHRRNIKDEDFYEDFYEDFDMIHLVQILFGINALMFFLDTIKLIIAPKLYLIDHFIN